METRDPDVARKNKEEMLEDADQELDEVAEARRSSKPKVECICPGCGKFHIVKMHWIGRGVPRKFCQSCRDRQAPLDDDSW
jgi:transposase-like protein